MGYLEKRGKTNAVHYILPRRYYELAGDTAAYSLATDWDANQVWAVIKPFLLKYNEAKRTELNTLIGNHVSEKQLRNYIEQLKKEGKLKTECRCIRGTGTFIHNNEVIYKQEKIDGR